mmetsp:Transcript_7244/g.18075  ORF Transcript_7244/g.18075 Transcript_7244/m.18075 type:complete len:737 (-) Transcript_7244:101-2311(-)
MASRSVFLAALLLCTAPSGLRAADVGLHQRGREEGASAAAANPIRKVVTLLQNMQKKVTEEGKKEEEAYDKFMCYCKTNKGELTESIETAKAKIDSLGAALKQAGESKTQTEADLKDHQGSRAEAKDTMAQATALREKEAAAYAKVKSDYDTNLAALAKAISAIENGMMGSFLQTPAANVVRRWAMEKAEMPDTTRGELLAFLSSSQTEGYTPQSSEITGILKQLESDMSKSLADATAEENAAIQNYEALMAAKKKEEATLTAQIEEEMARIADLGVRIAGMANDEENTKAALGEDEKFQLELESSCDTKTQEWEEIKKLRAEELVALAETIKVLNDDDALELFKKTLPGTSASFVQLNTKSAVAQGRALSIVKKASHGASRPDLDLISLALKGKKIGFEKVIAMIDDMVSNLKREQIDDDAKKEYCNQQFDESDDKRKGLELSISNSETAIEEMEGSISTLAEEVAALEAGIKALDKSVAEATELRKEENADYKDLMTSDATAKQVLEWAKNRLNKFYQPKLYKAPPKRELTEAERISTSMGGTPLATEAAGGIAGTGIGAALVQVSAHRQHGNAAPPPPETFGPYQKKSQESGGVIAMIDLLIKDLDKEMTEAGVMEKDAQAEYEKVMAESAAKRAADSKSITEKTSTKANTEEALQAEKDSKADAGKELMITMKFIKSLHSECDWLVQYYDVRKSARASEIEALGNAKAVLSGADYAFLQKASSAGFMAKRRA